jgi:hypothetical protein
VNEWERGYRAGLMSAANVVDEYVSQFKVTGNAAKHLYACAEGLRQGAIARDIEGRGK